ncbi:MAG: helix-turn-helix domain-containing protein [Gelidibacter sp.]
MKAINENAKVSKRELEDKISISPTAIDNNLDALKDLGLIERVGS